MDNDLIRRADAIAKIKAHSDETRAKMRAAHDKGHEDDYDAWSAITAHLDIAADAIRAIEPAHD